MLRDYNGKIVVVKENEVLLKLVEIRKVDTEHTEYTFQRIGEHSGFLLEKHLAPNDGRIHWMLYRRVPGDLLLRFNDVNDWPGFLYVTLEESVPKKLKPRPQVWQ